MAGRVLLAVAGAALLASAGAVTAAGIAPVVVPPIVVGPVAVPAGPEIGVRLQVMAQGPMFRLEGLGEIDVRTPSGWGFTFSALSFTLPQYSSAGTTLRARTYRVIGNAEIGAFAIMVPPFGPDAWDIDFGGDFTLDTDRVDIDHETTVDTHGATWNGVRSETKFTFDDDTSPLTLETTLIANLYIAMPRVDLSVDNRLVFAPVEHLEISVGLLANLTPLRFVPRIEVSLPFDWITPGVEFRFYPGSIDTNLTVELDRPLGDGPFSLIGNANAYFTNTTIVSYSGRIGLRYELGDPHEWY